MARAARRGDGMRLILRMAVVLAAMLLPAVASAGYTLAPEPTWVRVDQAPDPGSVPPGADDTRYLLVVDQVNLTGRRPAWYRRVSYVVGAERGLAGAGRFSINYQPDYQSVALHAVQVWRDGVVHERRDAVQVQELRREDDLESGILDGLHTLDVTIPDLKVGDRIDYSYSIEGTNPVFGDAWYDYYTATYSDPVGLRRVRAIHPADTPLYWKVTRDAFEVDSGALGTDARFVDISARDVPRTRAEEGEPSGYDSFGRIELGTADAWSDIVAWALPLYPAGFTDRAVADALVRELRLDDADKLAVMQRAIAFVQGQIRYTALDMGENSHAPYRPETTIARRFGDCKDKTQLLIALLHEAGIRAEPVLVNTGAGARIAERLPSAYAFDHVVARALVDGKTYWIDATRNRETGPLASRSPLPFGLGLPVCADCRQLVQIPYPMPAEPEVVVGERIDLQDRPDGYSADFVVVTDYRGARGRNLRNSFADEGDAEFGRRYLAYMRGYYDGIDSKGDPSIEPLEADNAYRTRERYELGWKTDEGSVFGIILFQLLDYLPKLDDGARKAPVAIGGPRLASHSVRTSYDKGWTIESEHHEVSNDYFSFRRDVSVEDGMLVIDAQWRRTADEVAAADVADVARDLEKVRDLLQYNVDLGGAAFPPGMFAPKAWLWPLLALSLVPILLVAAWLLRDRNAMAGMLFMPRRTMARLLASPPPSGRMWLLIVVAAVMEAIFTRVPPFTDKGLGMAAGVALGAGGMLALRTVIYTAIFGWALRALRVRADFDPLLASTAWAWGPPTVLFIALSLVAVGGDVSLLRDGEPAMEAVFRTVAAGLLVVVGSIWALVAMANAHAVAAGTSRGRVVGAWGIMLLAALLIVGSIALLARP